MLQDTGRSKDCLDKTSKAEETKEKWADRITSN
jgi:hypothetical protein